MLMKPDVKKDSLKRFGFLNNRFNSFFLDLVRRVTIATPRVVCFKGREWVTKLKTHQMNIILKAYKMKSVLSVLAHVVFKF